MIVFPPPHHTLPLPISHSALKKEKEEGKKKTFGWVFHGHQATLHTTFVDVCMHVHVSCQPASHQVLMRPAGSTLGPNQTGETAQSWLSPPCTPHLPKAHPPSLSSRYLGEPWMAERTRQIWKWPVCLLKCTMSPRSLGQGLN